MPVSAVITIIVVSVVLYGGFALCIRQAVRKGREEKAAHQEPYGQ
jgi:hypothetical protein